MMNTSIRNRITQNEQKLRGSTKYKKRSLSYRLFLSFLMLCLMPITVGIGLFFCLTLIGVVVGIPLIIMGVGGPVIALTAVHSGDCPACGKHQDWQSVSPNGWTCCRKCKQMIRLNSETKRCEWL